jgi:hypothetical protein
MVIWKDQGVFGAFNRAQSFPSEQELTRTKGSQYAGDGPYESRGLDHLLVSCETGTRCLAIRVQNCRA